MQNHAYDFSLASTNHSTKSRQAEPTELSQVSESFSHQVFHIYAWCDTA